MTDWAAFTGFTGLVLVALLSFAYFSRTIPHGDGVSAVSPDDTDARLATPSDDAPAGDDGIVETDTDEVAVSHLGGDSESAGGHAAFPTGDHSPPHTGDAESSAEATPTDHEPTPVHSTPDEDSFPADMPTYLLIANVAVSQAVLGGFLALGAWYAGVPVSAFGLSSGDVSTKLALGVVLGFALYVVNRVGTSLSRRLGFAPDEALRETLTPETPTGWVLLLVVALPLIAGFEELLFRGALVGALSVGFDVSPWFLAAVSSVAFGAGHTAQGRLGIVVTGLLGFVLAATFVLTGSLLVVVVAHYLVNALEFVGNELFGW